MFKRLANLSNRAVLGILLAVALLSSGMSLLVNVTYNVDTSPGWWVSWLQNFSTEMFGAFLTFILLEIIVGGREKRREEDRSMEKDKKRLIRQMQSTVNSEAVRAAEELRAHGWLSDGSLEGLSFADANLQGASLYSANLQGAAMLSTNLQGAYLNTANLQGVFLHNANLQDADLTLTNLQGARLDKTNLQGADLRVANLQGANLDNAQFDKNTLLPDETKWIPDTDMTRFTDLNHPNFWRPIRKVWWNPL